MAEEILHLFDSWIPYILNDTYLVCLSEHEEDEDFGGRLSMWRGYGPTTGVALVFNPAAMFSETDILHAYSYPVIYAQNDEIQALLLQTIQRLGVNEEHWLSLSREEIKGYIFNMLMTFSVCLKHKGFHEEKEWRVVYSPSMRRSDRIVDDLQVINGIPQKIFKIPLQDIPEHGLSGVQLPSLINRIIIGPNAQPQIVYSAFVDALKRAGVAGAEGKVFCSNIPLRK